MLTLIATLAPLLSNATGGAESPTGAWRQYATPEQAGFSSAVLADGYELAASIDSAAVFVVWRGHVLVAWGDVSRRFRCHSVRKSLLSALYGIHVDAGRIDLEATLADLGIDDREPLTETEKTARVVDLLRARSGVYHPAAKEPSSMRASRPARGSHAPDTHWWYNNWDFNTLLPIFEQATGTKVFEEFDRRFAQPLGMQDYRVRDGLYQLEPSKSRHAAYAFRLSARDLARFGLLFLHDGSWNGTSIVSADWVRESTDVHSAFDGGGYGYMWWSYPAGSRGADTALDAINGYDAFAARGTGGQFLLVIPEAELVFVHRGDTDNDRRVAGHGIWQLAELMLDARTGEPEPEPELAPVEPVPFANPGPEPIERDAIEVSAEVLAPLVGTYSVLPGFDVVIYEYEGRLFVRAPEGEVELFAETEERWFARGASAVLEFRRNEAGDVTSIRGEVDGQVLIARRQ